jgi:hypothetical protein
VSDRRSPAQDLVLLLLLRLLLAITACNNQNVTRPPQQPHTAKKMTQ